MPPHQLAARTRAQDLLLPTNRRRASLPINGEGRAFRPRRTNALPVLTGHRRESTAVGPADASVAPTSFPPTRCFDRAPTAPPGHHLPPSGSRSRAFRVHRAPGLLPCAEASVGAPVESSRPNARTAGAGRACDKSPAIVARPKRAPLYSSTRCRRPSPASPCHTTMVCAPPFLPPSTRFVRAPRPSAEAVANPAVRSARTVAPND